jgi:hypothetical protein
MAQPLLQQLQSATEETFVSGPLPEYVSAEDYHEGLKVSAYATARITLLKCFFAADPRSVGQRLWFWNRNLEDQDIHASQDWREEDHAGDAAMRKVEGLQEQGRAYEAVRDEDDWLPMASKDDTPSSRRLESNSVMSRAQPSPQRRAQ